MTGSVTLVGAGPGDPELITVAGLRALRSAEVVIHDRLIPPTLLAEARVGTVIIDVGKIPRRPGPSQESINDLLVQHGRDHNVVRLKGGDSFVFGRGGEEIAVCTAAGIPVRVIPGITSAVAAPELAGIPVTQRGLSQGFTVVSGHLPPGHPGSTIDWAALARTNTTLVVMMGVAEIRAIVAALTRAGMSADIPAAVIASAGTPAQRMLSAAVGDLPDTIDSAGIRPPAVIIIGAVAGLSDNIAATAFRTAAQ
jgi:uroporphyrin-III C-methyltransferase